jgi:murein DD-endopeptidase MepM/ murein hydrolase activator NlpD
MWRWPLLARPPVPKPGEPGAFGTRRKHDTHTGVDLYCEEGSPVFAVEPGRVVRIEQFTGDTAGSPWWRRTWAVLVEGASGVVVYGELHDPTILTREDLREGDAVGRVTRVLVNAKGRPPTMLHLELYAAGTRETTWWRDDRPSHLLDPTPFLLEAL